MPRTSTVLLATGEGHQRCVMLLVQEKGGPALHEDASSPGQKTLSRSGRPRCAGEVTHLKKEAGISTSPEWGIQRGDFLKDCPCCKNKLLWNSRKKGLIGCGRMVSGTNVRHAPERRTILARFGKKWYLVSVKSFGGYLIIRAVHPPPGSHLGVLAGWAGYNTGKSAQILVNVHRGVGTEGRVAMGEKKCIRPSVTYKRHALEGRSLS